MEIWKYESSKDLAGMVGSRKMNIQIEKERVIHHDQERILERMVEKKKNGTS